MATVKAGTIVASKEWWKHLRWFNKRIVAKAERKAATKQIKKDLDSND